jgi:hypothetical protein
MPDPQSYQAIGWLVVGLGAVILALNQGVNLIRGFRGEPPAEQLKLIAEALARRVDELEIQRGKDLQYASDRRQLIYQEFKTQRAEFLREIKDVYKLIEQDKKDLNLVLRNLPNEVIATLRHTNVIK